MRKLTAPIVLHGKLEYGELCFDRPSYLKAMLNKIENIEVRITIEPKRGKKSNQQLGYLYGVLYALLAEETGHSVEEIDRIMKGKFLIDKVLWRGSEIITAKGKAELNNMEMGDYITAVCGEAADLGIIVPEPNREWDTLSTAS